MEIEIHPSRFKLLQKNYLIKSTPNGYVTFTNSKVSNNEINGFYVIKNFSYKSEREKEEMIKKHGSFADCKTKKIDVKDKNLLRLFTNFGYKFSYNYLYKNWDGLKAESENNISKENNDYNFYCKESVNKSLETAKLLREDGYWVKIQNMDRTNDSVEIYISKWKKDEKDNKGVPKWQ